jgi:hypothetical protein
MSKIGLKQVKFARGEKPLARARVDERKAITSWQIRVREVRSRVCEILSVREGMISVREVPNEIWKTPC